jgi:hypothetical protein
VISFGIFLDVSIDVGNHLARVITGGPRTDRSHGRPERGKGLSAKLQGIALAILGGVNNSLSDDLAHLILAREAPQ